MWELHVMTDSLDKLAIYDCVASMEEGEDYEVEASSEMSDAIISDSDEEKNSGSEMEQEITEHGVNEELDGMDADLEDTGIFTAAGVDVLAAVPTPATFPPSCVPRARKSTSHDLNSATSSCYVLQPTHVDSSLSDSELSSEGDTIDQEEQLRRTVLRIEKEEFLKEYYRSDRNKFDEKIKKAIAHTSQGEPSRQQAKKGYLHWKKKDLERALRSSAKGASLPSKPYFIQKNKNI